MRHARRARARSRRIDPLAPSPPPPHSGRSYTSSSSSHRPGSLLVAQNGPCVQSSERASDASIPRNPNFALNISSWLIREAVWSDHLGAGGDVGKAAVGAADAVPANDADGVLCGVSGASGLMVVGAGCANLAAVAGAVGLVAIAGATTCVLVGTGAALDGGAADFIDTGGDSMAIFAGGDRAGGGIGLGTSSMRVAPS